MRGRFMRGLGVAILVLAGGAVNAHAFDLGDLTDWMDECNLGNFFHLPTDGVVFGNPFVGQAVDFGECSGTVDLADFWLPESGLRSIPSASTTSGKLVVDLKRKYWFDTNGNAATIEWQTGEGSIWRWKKASRAEYFKATYTQTAYVSTSGWVNAAMTGTAVANTTSMTPASASGAAIPPAGYTTITDIGKDMYNMNRYAEWPNGVMIRYITKQMRSKNFVKNSAGTKKTVNIELGRVVVRAVPKNGKLHQHIVFRVL